MNLPRFRGLRTLGDRQLREPPLELRRRGVRERRMPAAWGCTRLRGNRRPRSGPALSSRSGCGRGARTRAMRRSSRPSRCRTPSRPRPSRERCLLRGSGGRRRSWCTAIRGGVMHQTVAGLAPGDRHVQRAGDDLGLERPAHRPADHAAGAGVEDDGKIEKALVGPDVRDVGDPESVRTVGGEVATD